MKRIALILSLTGSPALAEITPMDVIESLRTVYAGLGETISYGSLETGPDGRSVRLNDVSSIEIMGGSTITSHIDWMRMQPNADGSILITFSPEGKQVDVTPLPDGTEITTTTKFDFSALALVASGYPSDIRYSYSAPKITYSTESGDTDFGNQIELTVTDLSGDETAITNVTESGPRVSDSGEYRAARVNIRAVSRSPYGPPSVADVAAENVGLNFRWEFPLTDIPTEPVPISDLPQQMDIDLKITTGPLRGSISQGNSLDPSNMVFGYESGSANVRFAHNQFRFDLVSSGGTFGKHGTEPMPNFDLALAELRANLAMPFRRAPTAAPFTAGFSLDGLTLDETSWASEDPENSMGRPAADISVALSGLMQLTSGMFEGTAGLDGENATFFVPDLTLDSLRIAAAGAVIEGQGDIRFDRRRTDPETGLPMAKGALDFSIIGALGFLDRFGRLPDVDAMAILSAKGGLGMFASPTDTQDSFTSHVELLSGGGIVLNGHTVR